LTNPLTVGSVTKAITRSHPPLEILPAAGFPAAFRLLGFWDAGRLVILTNGFAKKTQKTPEREIALAEQRKRDHLNRRK